MLYGSMTGLASQQGYADRKAQASLVVVVKLLSAVTIARVVFVKTVTTTTSCYECW